MRSKKPFSAGKPTFVIFITLLLATAIVPTQAEAQTFKVLHTFHGKDGAFPLGQLLRDGDGNIYGTTGEGGSGKCYGYGCGTVFKLSSTGKLLWSYSFNGKDGFDPYAGVLRDAKGNLYGTTSFGGIIPKNNDPGSGVVFKLDTARKETVLHKFAGNCNGDQDGYFANSLLVGDAAGNLYGTTLGGGTGNCGGTVFKVNNASKETILHSFPGAPKQNLPGPGVIFRPDGKLYGVTEGGGSHKAGTVFRMSTSGKQAILYNFNGSSDGGVPASVLVSDKAGNLYGTTRGGGGNCGVNGCGTLFELTPQAGGGWTQKTLYTFCQESQCADGWRPGSGPLVVDAAGNLYGTTDSGGNFCNMTLGCGTVFKLDRSGQETVVYSFSGGADGWAPEAGLTMDDKGNLYGTAEIGGDLNCVVGGGQGCGVVFKLTP